MATARSRYMKFQASVVALQCGFRKRCAKKQLRELKLVSGGKGVGYRERRVSDD